MRRSDGNRKRRGNVYPPPQPGPGPASNTRRTSEPTPKKPTIRGYLLVETLKGYEFQCESKKRRITEVQVKSKGVGVNSFDIMKVTFGFPSRQKRKDPRTYTTVTVRGFCPDEEVEARAHWAFRDPTARLLFPEVCLLEFALPTAGLG